MKASTYSHSFILHAPLDRVRDFHFDPAAVARITPPGLGVRVDSAPPRVADGARMEFTIYLGPIGVRWVASFEAVSPSGFVDRQLEGPFAMWVHEHRFDRVSETQTAVVDTITAALGDGIRKRILSRSMWAGLPILFAYRGWKTRRLLDTAQK